MTFFSGRTIHRVLAALAIATVCSTTAWAGAVALTLVRVTLENVSDAAGVLQHEAGAVQNAAGTEIGRYILQRRSTTGGAIIYNAGAETITLFFAPAVATDAPHVVTLQGAHSWSSGEFLGSVSASSLRHHSLIGADASVTQGGTKLVIDWVGGAGFRFP